MTTFKVSPSDFAFLYEECPRCWWMKVHGHRRIGDPLPAIFNHMDAAMRRFLTVEAYQALGIPVASFYDCTEYVRSQPHEAHGAAVVISGRRDRTVRMQDGTLGVIDHKLTHPNERHAEKYSRQLHSYEYALRRPEGGGGDEVGYLGLVCFDAYDARFKASEDDCALIGKLVSVPVEIDRGKFEGFLDEVCGQVALAPEDAPEPAQGCAWCRAVVSHAQMFMDWAQAQNNQSPRPSSTPKQAQNASVASDGGPGGEGV